LAVGELAFNEVDGGLYIGRSNASVVQVNAGGGGAKVTISDTPPVTPNVGDLWWESDSGALLIWYNDGTSTQWVAIAAGSPSVSTRVLLATLSPVGVANVDFTVPPASAGYDFIQFVGFLTGTNPARPTALVSYDGTTWSNGANDYSLEGISSNQAGTTGAYSGVASSIVLANPFSTGISAGMSFDLKFQRPTASGIYKDCKWQINGADSSGNWNYITAGGMMIASAWSSPIQKIRLATNDASNFTANSWCKVYGYT
jgi:hypothetical protein